MIKCNSCGRDCQIGTEQVDVDNMGIPVYHRFTYCDSCMVKYDLDIEIKEHCPRCDNVQLDRQNGGYAIVGFILSMVSLVQLLASKSLPFNSLFTILTTPLSVAAFVLCVLGIGDKWSGVAKIGVLVFIITVIVAFFYTPTWLVGVLII